MSRLKKRLAAAKSSKSTVSGKAGVEVFLLPDKTKEITGLNLIAITKETTPAYLRTSELFQTFHERKESIEGVDGDDDDSTVMIPFRFCKPNESIYSQYDLMHYCHSVRYWGMPQISREIIKAALSESALEVDWSAIVHEFGSELPYLKHLADLRTIKMKKRINAAIERGCSLEIVKYLYEEGYTVPRDVCITAGRAGRLDVLEFFYDAVIRADDCCSDVAITCNWNRDVLVAATANGYVDCLQYAHEHGCEWDPDVAVAAAENGNLNCLQYAHEHGCDWNFQVMLAASSNGHLDCLQYAHEHGCEWTSEVTSCSSRNGHLDCLQYAYEHGCPWEDSATNHAAMEGHLDCLKYAHEHGCHWNNCVTFFAAAGGHLDCLQYAHEHGCEWTSDVTRNSAAYGHLDCLQYAHEHGCEWTSEVSRYAAENGHLDCLRYAHEHGCVWEGHFTRCTAERFHPNCVSYVKIILNGDS